MCFAIETRSFLTRCVANVDMAATKEIANACINCLNFDFFAIVIYAF